MNMKILEVIFNLSPGGGERFVVDLSNQLNTDGHNVQLLTFKSKTTKNGLFYKNELSENISFTDLAFVKMNLVSMFRIFAVVKRAHADIVHMHLSTLPFFCLFPILFYRKSKYVVTQHIIADAEKERGDIKYYVKKILVKLHLINLVSIGYDNQISISRVYNIKSNMIINGRKPLMPTLQINEVVDEVERLKNGKDVVVFCNIARFNIQKNHERLIRCFNSVISKGHQVILLIIGSGFDSKKGEELKQRADKSIYFLGEKHNIGDYLLCSDCFCLSSDWEGMPITLLEALSCGCVPVGTPVSGFNDLIKNGLNGFVAKDFSDIEFEKAIINAKINYKKVSKGELKNEFNQKYSMEICAKKYESFFENVILNKYVG